MSLSISLDMKQQVSVVRTSSGFANASDNTVTIDGMTVDKTGANRLSASTTPPVTKSAFTAKALSAGAATIDLTAMADDDSGTTVDFTGLKVQCLILKNPSSNANKITVTKGATNGYGTDAAGGSWTEVLDPGASVLKYIADTAPDVGSGAKTFDVTGTGSQVLDIGVVAG